MSLRTLLHLGVLPLLLLLASQPAFSQERALSDEVAPYLDSQTLAVFRADLEQLDLKSAVQAFAKELPAAEQEQLLQQMTEGSSPFAAVQALKDAGVSSVWIIASLADLPGQPVIVVRPKPGANQEKIKAVFEKFKFPEAFDHGKDLVIAQRTARDRLETQRPKARPDLAAALAAAGNHMLIAAISPNDDSRRVLRETLPPIPEQFGTLSGQELADGARWAVAGLDLPPKGHIHMTLEASDSEMAEKFREVALKAIQLVSRRPDLRQGVDNIDAVAELFTPRRDGKRLVIELSKPADQQLLLESLAKPIIAARGVASEMQAMNNLKQLGLAIHMYADAHARLPAAALRSSNGKKLLSWRVEILPYLGEQKLYDEFRLDEPWDSEHNKPLIERMPAVFAPQLHAELRAKGQTLMLAPVAKDSIFGSDRGSRFTDVTDGLSNTIMVVQAAPESAVEWTKPADWEVNLDKPLEGLLVAKDKQFLVLLGDGAVHRLPASIDAETMRRLVQMNDGKPVDFQRTNQESGEPSNER